MTTLPLLAHKRIEIHLTGMCRRRWRTPVYPQGIAREAKRRKANVSICPYSSFDEASAVLTPRETSPPKLRQEVFHLLGDSTGFLTRLVA